MAVPVIYPSTESELEPSASSGTVRARPTKVLKSTFPATDWVQSPLISSGDEPSQHAQARSPVTSSGHVRTQLHSSMGSPVDLVTPPGTRVGYSFDSDESEPYAVHESRPWWQLLWAFCSILFITVLIPTIVFLMSTTRTGHAPPTFTGGATRTTSSVNVTYTPSTIPQRTTGLPRVTFDPEEDFLLKPGESVQEFCERKTEPDRSPVLPNGTWPTTAFFNASRNDIQLRPVICVFDAKYWRLQEPYLPTLLPLYYCSAIVVYGYAIDASGGSIVWKYPTAVPYLQALLNMSNTRQLLHRGNNITVYFTLGGDREDSKNLSLAAGRGLTRRLVAQSVRQEITNVSQQWGGVNVDWNFPGDYCNTGGGRGAALYYALISELKTSPINVMISISPVKDRLSAYSLGMVAGMVDYVIIKTHTHIVPPSLFSVVRCSGDQLVAADVFNKALSMLPKMEDQFRLGYSISVAPETFLAPAAQLGAPVLGTMQWDNHTRQPGRTSYASVCQEKPVIRTSMHPLCLMVARQVDSQTVHVATFADERALMERMNLTYSDNMAMAPVAVFDIDLDDFNGTCGNGMSPLVRAIATGPG